VSQNASALKGRTYGDPSPIARSTIARVSDLPPEITAYYAAYAEESRLATGAFQLEFERTKEIVTRVLPPPPARVVDVGGAAGAYSFWLAQCGYDVHLVDASPRLVGEATRRNASARSRLGSAVVGDARALPHDDGSTAAVLVMGPLYHLVDGTDRALALREAYRVLQADGVVVVAAISRYASTLDGLARKLTLDPRFVAIRNRDLADGQHRNTTERGDYFTTAYFHRPEDLRRELEAAGFTGVSVLAVEGPCWILSDFDARWADSAQRADLLDVARRLEAEPSMLGISAHLLGVGRKA
jgi:ubiquinone/menaquinone biosynthesis C-methylase UbiE